jgi:hypothetical protein
LTAKKILKTKRRAEIARFIQENPDIKISDVAKRFALSEGPIKSIRKEYGIRSEWTPAVIPKELRERVISLLSLTEMTLEEIGKRVRIRKTIVEEINREEKIREVKSPDGKSI